MSSVSEQQKSGQSPLCALWSVDLKLTHLDWNPEATLIHFQGHYLSICDLDYNILQGEIQNTPKTQAAVAIGEFCLVEDLTSGHCYRGRVQNRKEDLFDVFLIDHDVPLKQSTEQVPDLLIEKPRAQEFCFKRADLQGYEYILSLCGPRLSCGTRAKVRVTAAVNPELFYCQMTSVDTDLWEMSKKLAEVNEYQTMEHNQKTPENLGLLCSVKGKDEKWHRGLVQFLPVNSQLQVLYIDYGFLESVKVENVYRLPPELFSTPIMAFPCSLFSLGDEVEAVKTQQLSFLKAGLLGKVLDVEIKRFEEQQHLYSITVIGAEENQVAEPKPTQELPKMKVPSVFEMEEKSPQCGYLNCETIMGKAMAKTLKEEELDVNSVFVGYVEHVQNPNIFWIRSQQLNDEFEEMMTKMADNYSQVKLDEDVLLNPEPGTLCCAVYEKDMHFYRRAVSNKALRVHIVQKGKNKCVVDLYVMEDDNNQSITELLISSKQAQYWNNIDLEPAVKNKTTFTEKTRRPKHRVTPDITGNSEQLRDCAEEEKTFKNLTEKAQALFKAISIKPGYIFAVCCTWINSPSDFWCQLQDKVPALEELMDKVNQYYSIHRVPLQSGDSCCVAKSPLDGRWYRAFITQKHNGHAIVMLVDYGLTIHIKEHNLQAIKPEFVHLEGQAFRCSLSTPIKPTGLDDIGNCSPECKLMKDFVLDTPIGLRCQVVSQFSVKNKGLCSVVELYNIQTQKTLTNLGDKGLPREALFSTKQQHIVFPESFVYSSYDISPGNEEQLHVTHVSSQWEVYCQLDRNTDIIDELENNISTESEKMMQATTTAVTKLCLAKYSDGKWYRGLVQPVQSPLHLNVFFVDYGNATISEKTNVMCIPRDSMDVLYTPMQAVKCHLASVSKEPLYADVKDWLDGAILNKQVRAVVNGKYKDGSFFVELFDGDVNINEKVRELIRSLSPTPKTVVTFDVSSTKTNHKTHQKPNTKDSIKCKKASSDSSCMLDACRSTQAGRAPCKKKENLVKTVHGQTQKTNARVEKQGEYTYTNSKQPQITEESEIPQCSCLPNRSVSAGFRAKCFVSHIDSVSSFDLQLSEDEPSILKMGEDLNSSSFRETLKTTTSLRVNDIVLAEFEEDGALYRSAVTDCDGNSFIKVEFVDYGNSAVIKKENTYSLPKEYLSQPRFSISCSLMDTSMYQNDASFTDAVMEKPLMVEFVSHQESHWVVKFEIIDEAAGLPTALEADVESTYETIKEEAFHADSSKNEEKARSSEQNYMRKEVSENQTTQSERASLDGENQTLEPTVKADEIMPPTVQDKDTKSGTVLSVLSNGNFYISLNETRELLAALEHFIAENLSVCKILAEEDVKQGLKCLVQVDHDKKWHRAVVQVVGQGNARSSSWIME
ncbi:Tudor domain containing protein 6 [Dissostichus eleginoides]|uniref:Tudor domain containing protein 6 n=1 Tax=Dissostichus eleginoides TaxID=100907 RepID=A0AAD9B0I8_DISEL|nr:Tudor domain containing protein 6 [Dissostichus eleginoides]